MKTEKRIPWKAMVASLVMPGLGQVYNGQVSRGLNYFLALAFGPPAAIWIGQRLPDSLLFACVLGGVLLGLAIYALSAIDAWNVANRIGTISLSPLQKLHVYACLALIGYGFVLKPIADYTRSDWLEAYKIPSTSMVPNILQGDHIFVDKRVNKPGAAEVRHGDLAIFVNPNNRSQIYIKRVIGLPKDTVEIRGNQVFVNGKSIQTDSITERSENGTYAVAWGKESGPVKVSVPDGHVFLLGDNRGASNDSRYFGTVPLVDLVGKVKQIWLSLGDGGVRWSRIGKVVDSNG